MRKLILKMECTLDGHVGGADGDVDWAFPDMNEAYQQWIVPLLASAGAHLMGANLYRDMAPHWPTSTEAFAAPMNNIPKVVFSRTLQVAEWGETHIERGDLGSAVRLLKQQPGKPLLAHGGARFAQALWREGLVDECWWVMHPVMLGAGLRMFPAEVPRQRFEVAEQTAFGNGLTAWVLRKA